MDRKMFEAGILAKKEEMKNEAHGEALEMDKKRNELLTDVAAKKSELAEIEGKPEIATSSKKERTAAEKEMVKEWENFLKDCFPEKQFDLSGLDIPERTPEEEKEFTRLQFRSGSLSNETLFQKCKELFPTWKDTNESLDDVVIKKDVKDSFIWVRNEEAADEKHKNKSADMIEKEGLKTENLSDRLLHELKYFKETGKHLDENTVTITSARGAVGLVWIVRWFVGKLGVYRDDSDNRYDRLRPRQIVSSPTKSEK